MTRSVHPAVVTLTLLVLSTFNAPAHAASETLTSEPVGEAYNFVTHYRVQIDAPAAAVWPYLLDFRSWIYEFEHTTVSGVPGTPGHVARLYEGQEFLTQVTAVVPEQMIAIVNLPLTFNGELGTGVGVFTLHDHGSRTEVALSMSRRYTHAGEDTEEGFSDLKATRGSVEFQARSRTMWQDRFLGRLKAIVEERDDRG